MTLLHLHERDHRHLKVRLMIQTGHPVEMAETEMMERHHRQLAIQELDQL